MNPAVKKRLLDGSLWLLAGAILAVMVLSLFGCAAVPTAEDPPQTVWVPAWPAGEDGEPDTSGFPLWLQIITGLGVAIAAPRTRRNLVGAVGALASGEGKRAAAHVAALTPFVGSPTEALPEAQRGIIKSVENQT